MVEWRLSLLKVKGFCLSLVILLQRHRCLKIGPWFIANRPLLLQKWQSGQTLEKFLYKKFPVWVVLRRVPLKLRNSDGLSCIASVISSLLSLAKATEKRRLVHFARMCVEVSTGDVLPDTILVDIEGYGEIKVSVEYAWKPIVRTLCKALGHTDQFCKASKE